MAKIKRCSFFCPQCSILVKVRNVKVNFCVHINEIIHLVWCLSSGRFYAPSDIVFANKCEYILKQTIDSLFVVHHRLLSGCTDVHFSTCDGINQCISHVTVNTINYANQSTIHLHVIKTHTIVIFMFDLSCLQPLISLPHNPLLT